MKEMQNLFSLHTVSVISLCLHAMRSCMLSGLFDLSYLVKYGDIYLEDASQILSDTPTGL